MDTLEEAILDACQLSPLASETGPARAWRALYIPAFHRDCVVEIRERAGGADLLLVSCGPSARNAWGRASARAEGPARWADEPLTVATAEIEPGRYSAMRAALSSLALFELGDVNDLGRDGIGLLGEVRDGARSHRFRAWSPEARQHPRHAGYFAAMARFAVSSLPAGPAVVVVESCLRYLAR